MSCKRANELMMKHMDDELCEHDLERLYEHFGVCVKCREDFAAYVEIMKEFQNNKCLLDAPDEFEQVVMTKIARLEPEEKRGKKEMVVAVLVGVLSVLLGAALMFGGAQGAETILSALPYVIYEIVDALSQYGFVLFFFVSALIVLQTLIRVKKAKNK